MEVLIPQLAWFGDSELKLKFPEEWNVSVQVMEGHDKKSMDKEENVYALRNPVGTKPLGRLARSKSGRAFQPLRQPVY